SCRAGCKVERCRSKRASPVRGASRRRNSSWTRATCRSPARRPCRARRSPALAREPPAQFELDARDLQIAGAPAVPSASITGELSPGLVKVASLRAEVEGVELSAAGQVEHAQWQLPVVVHLDRA